MASVAGSANAHGRSVPSWAAPEIGENITEALEALDSYKKKDPSKGTIHIDILSPSSWLSEYHTQS